MKKILGSIVLSLFASLAFGQAFGVFQPGGDLAGSGSTWNNQVIAPGVVTLAKQANLTADTIQCNPTSSPATPTACNPMAVANLMEAVLSVFLVSVNNITLSGTPTIDGVNTQPGSIILVDGQSTASQNGIYVVASGAWSLAINFPAGYVIPQNCSISVFVQFGNAYGGHTFRLTSNIVSSVTIGTSSISFSDASLAPATATSYGIVKITDAANLTVPATAGAAVVLGTNTVTAYADCAVFADSGSGLSGSIGDVGNIAGTTGPCIVGDSYGHPVLNGTGTAPTVSGTGCSLTTGGQDNHGSIVASGIDTCTLTFGSSFTKAPNCAVGNIGATVLANLTGLPTTAHAIFATAAAGTFNYLCL